MGKNKLFYNTDYERAIKMGKPSLNHFHSVTPGSHLASLLLFAVFVLPKKWKINSQGEMKKNN